MCSVLNADIHPMTANELLQLCQLVEGLCGIQLDASKQYLLETRLLKTLIEYNCASYSDFIQLMKTSAQVKLKPLVIDAMTTKETLWFRDVHPYETIASNILPDLLNQNPIGSLKFWSAACSTGQEPYSLAMLVHEYAEAHPHLEIIPKQRVHILGTDVASSSIALSKLARYDILAMGRGISPERKNKFFESQGRVHVVRDEVKALCEFKIANLGEDLTNSVGRNFDLICLRNVAIYFSPEFRQVLFNRLAKMLKPNGYLVLGATENLTGLQTPFIPQSIGKTTVFRLRG
jgi:chemotaxis protein methyltransferase CheR